MCNKFTIVVSVIFRSEAAGYIYIFCNPLTVIICAEGNKLLAFYSFKHINCIFVITIINNNSGCVITEFSECFFDIFKVSEEIKVILINIKNNCHISIHMKKGVVEFTGFTNEILAVSVSSVCINNRQFSAYNRTRIKPCLKQYLCCHRRNSGFAVRSANAYAVGEYSADCT